MLSLRCELAEELMEHRFILTVLTTSKLSVLKFENFTENICLYELSVIVNIEYLLTIEQLQTVATRKIFPHNYWEQH